MCEIKIIIYLKNKKKFVIYADKKEKFDQLYIDIKAAKDRNDELVQFYNLILPVKDFYMAEYVTINKKR